MSFRIVGDVVTASAVERGGAVVVDSADDGLIEAVESAPGTPDYDFSGLLIVPGFVDLHVHGAAGLDFMDATEAGTRTIAKVHARFGTTTLLATSWTATPARTAAFIDAVIPVIRECRDDEARIAGIHLEGPYICAHKRGAQPLEPIRAPDWPEMRSWIERSGGCVKVMTMAAETEGALAFIEMAAQAGVLISIGHTSANYDQTVEALRVGATHATHLFNAMPPLGHRTPGAVGALLESGDTFVELISDGVHVHPAVLRIVVAAKGAGRVILITDAIAGAGMPDGDYQIDARTIRVRDGAARLEDGTLAGSVLTMNRAFANIQKFAGVSASEASGMTAGNASRRIGLTPAAGCLEVGRRADLAIVHPESGAVAATMRGGKWIWRA